MEKLVKELNKKLDKLEGMRDKLNSNNFISQVYMNQGKNIDDAVMELSETTTQIINVIMTFTNILHKLTTKGE